jgi:hypothetical protein
VQEFGVVAVAFLLLALAADAGRLACSVDGCKGDPASSSVDR